MTMLQVIDGRERDLGGFVVRRALPAEGRMMIGPFIFFDQLRPAQFAAGHGIDVRPHPHIGLASVTFLFSGALEHRDNLGNEREIHQPAATLPRPTRGAMELTLIADVRLEPGASFDIPVLGPPPTLRAVGSLPERSEAAKLRRKNQEFAPVPHEPEFIPLPS